MNITISTKMRIGYQFEMAIPNGVKIIAAKNRQIVITVVNDLYNVWGFNVKGVNIVKEKKINEVFIEQLNDAIIEAYSA